jgi:hypothetical protein
MRTVFTFQSSAFNTSAARDHFINPACFGDDVARWLAAGLRERGCQAVSEPEQEDHGWYLEFDVPEGRHCCVVGFRPDDTPGEECWIGWVERSTGFFASLTGGRNRNIAASALEAVHGVLSGASEIQQEQWYRRQDFDAGREDGGASTPNTA